MMVIDALVLSHWDKEFLHLLKAGGVTCVHASCGLWENARETISKIGEWQRFFEEHADLIYQVKTGEDMDEALRQGKIGVILGLQNTSALEDELSLVSVFNTLGIKVMQLTYNNQNLIGSSCYEEHDNGLSRYGKLVVEKMNEYGVMIDLSHVGERTTLDTIQYSSRPVAITHANPNWIYPTKRNKSKEVLSALRENKGMLGVCAYPHLIGGKDTSLQEFCYLIKETVDFMGVDHVGLGTDLTYNMPIDFLHWMRMGRWTHEIDYGAGSKENPSWPEWPEWFQSPKDFPNIITGLKEVGMSLADIEKIMGENWYLFFKESFQRKRE